MGAERRPGQEAHQQFKAGLPGINGVVGRSEERAVGALAQRFTYHTVEEIPAGVNPLQWDFLREAWLSGAYKKLKPKTAEMIDRYYHTEDTQADIAKDYNVTQGAVWERITRGMAKMRRVMYRNNPTLAQEDP